jgi:MinD-like ATPase involved in chromosome partitioning or flagellar assembly
VTRVLAIHSHSGGTGKSTFAANLGTVLATEGLRVLLVDTDVQAPGLHVLLGLSEPELTCTLSNFLLGDCEIDDAVYDVGNRLPEGTTGGLWVVPSRLDSQVITELVGGGYDAGLLDEGLRLLQGKLEPDIMILDTQAGMNNETMVALSAADAVMMLLRADEQDFQGAGVTTSAARRMTSPHTFLLVNMVSREDDPDRVQETAEAAYGCPVTAVLPHSPVLAELASRSVFVLEHPDHPHTEQLRLLAKRLLDETPEPGSTPPAESR